MFVLGMALLPASAGAQAPRLDAVTSSGETAVFAWNEPKQELKAGKVLHAARIRGTAPTIDGNLGDEVWTLADRTSGYVQRDPDNGKPMTEQTWVQVAFDDRYLYVAIRPVHASQFSLLSSCSGSVSEFMIRGFMVRDAGRA